MPLIQDQGRLIAVSEFFQKKGEERPARRFPITSSGRRMSPRFALVPVILFVVGLAACYLPARAAMRLDPMNARHSNNGTRRSISLRLRFRIAQ